jgi:prevent-host-death family protein
LLAPFRYGLVIAKSSGHIEAMPVVKVSELKNRLSHYLRLVRRGESVLVSDRDRVIARIEPAGDAASTESDEARWLDDLERRGIVRRGAGKLPRGWLARRTKVKANVVDALLEERREGR